MHRLVKGLGKPLSGPVGVLNEGLGRNSRIKFSHSFSRQEIMKKGGIKKLNTNIWPYLSHYMANYWISHKHYYIAKFSE